jgi:uncharacterized radical SAM protein YgiQ
MGEMQTLEIAERLDKNESLDSLNNVRGTLIVRKNCQWFKDYVSIPSFEEVSHKKEDFSKAFWTTYSQMDPFKAKAIVQKHADRFVVQLPPALPLNTQDLDYIHELAYARDWHPVYDRLGGVRGFETVRFSIISHRGCCGECSFCSLYFHQGRIIQSRSQESILKEARTISENKDFKGTITDIGGPTANLYRADCSLWKSNGFCDKKKCLIPVKCKNLQLGYKESLDLYRKIRELPRVKHVFIGSGFRYDLLTDEHAKDYLEEICKFHISGQMKVAPEHITDKVLKIMNKPPFISYEKFISKFYEMNRQLNKKQFLVNYFISSHPGSTLQDALKLALYFLKKNMQPEQIQDFIPLPMTLAACLYHTAIHPLTGEKVYIAKTFRERKMQRALIQYRNPANKRLILEALKELNSLPLLKKFFKKHNG